MAAFPEIVDGFALSPENMGILADAFRERLTALAVDPYSADGPTAATKAAYYERPMLALIQGNATERCCWRQMQEDLQWMALRYANPASYADAYYPVQLYADLSSWRAAAGLPSGGFRRGEDGTDYGLIAHRDPLRGWILQDIIIGLKSLVWTRSTQFALTDTEERWAIDPGRHSSLAAAIAAGDVIWAAAAWESGGIAWRQSLFEVAEEYGNYWAVGLAKRARGTITFREAAPARYSAEFLTWGTNQLDDWYDLEGHPKETWKLVETVVGAANDSSVTMAGTSIDSPSATPFASGIRAANRYAESTGYWFRCILKWTFSHS